MELKHDMEQEIKIRLACGSVLSLYTDKDGLNIDLDETTSPHKFSQLASTLSPYRNGIQIFVKEM